MSWKAGLSRHLPVLRFFACTESPACRGLLSWYKGNYEQLKSLNPNLGLLLRTTEGAQPAITTELDFTTDDLLRYMLQTNRFVDPVTSQPAHDRIEAAQDYLQTDWVTLRRERWSSPGFDPDRPFIEEDDPDWRTRDPKITKDLGLYLQLRDAKDEQLGICMDGPDDEWTKAENSLLMCQRVDLWCAGEKEVDAAVKHLYCLGRRFNCIETEKPRYIEEFYPGASDL